MTGVHHLHSIDLLLCLQMLPAEAWISPRLMWLSIMMCLSTPRTMCIAWGVLPVQEDQGVPSRWSHSALPVPLSTISLVFNGANHAQD